MTPDETTRAIELLIQSQQLMAKNLETLFEITEQTAETVQQTARDTAQNTRAIESLTERLDRLALIVADYLRGLRNGH